MKDLNEKTGIIYARVSSSEQVQGTSLGMQERLCREYAERENIKILNCYIEEGESAKTADRTEFKKALAFCSDKKNPVNFFIVHKIDRFARNQGDHFATQAILKQYGTELRSVSEPIGTDPVGKAMEGMLAVFAEFDNNVRSSRSKSGMIEKVRKGYWIWQAPLGYKRLTKGGNLVIDDELAPYIKLAFEEYSKGTYTYQSLSDFLEARGFRTRKNKKPCAQLVEKIIHNPAYYALIKAFGEENKGGFPAIIDEDLFWKCQPNVRSRTSGVPRIKNNAYFPLRGTLCLACSQKITGSNSTGRMGVKYPYYHHYKHNCSVVHSIPKETFEQNFIEYLQEISPSERFAKIFKAIVVDIWQKNYRKLDSENASVRKEIENLESERQKVFDLHRTGKYSDDEFLEQKNLINTVVQQKKLLLEEKRVEEFDMDAALEYCFRFVRNTADTWLKLKKLPAHRTRFQKKVFPEKITFDGKIFGTTKMSLVYKLNKENGEKKSDLVTLRGIEPRFKA